jgi:hypothetical protein
LLLLLWLSSLQGLQLALVLLVELGVLQPLLLLLLLLLRWQQRGLLAWQLMFLSSFSSVCGAPVPDSHHKTTCLLELHSTNTVSVKTVIAFFT